MPLVIFIAVRVLAAGPVARVVMVQRESGQPSAVALSAIAVQQINDFGRSDAEVQALLSDSLGYPVTVATYSGAFECRRVQLSWELVDAGLPEEDVRVCTWHLIKLTAGAPDADWVAGDFNEVVARFTTWWNALKVCYTEQTKLATIKFYREGPSIEPPQPPVFESAPAILGTATNANMLPPQVALSVTEKTSIRRSWGRFYLPAMATAMADAVAVTSNLGRIPTEVSDIVANATDAMYEGFITDGFAPVVYRRELPVREDADGDQLPARAASALSVDTLQIDNLWDVIRSRRYSAPTLRTLRGVG